MDMSDYAGRYMVAEAAYNAGDAGPYAAMFAEQITVNGNALTREAFAGVLAANVASGMRFRTVGLSVYGVLLIVHGELTLPEGGTIAQVGIVRFDENGFITEFTIVQGPLP